MVYRVGGFGIYVNIQPNSDNSPEAGIFRNSSRPSNGTQATLQHRAQHLASKFVLKHAVHCRSRCRKIHVDEYCTKNSATKFELECLNLGVNCD